MGDAMLDAGDTDPALPPFEHRCAAGRQLAGALQRFKNQAPIVLALPRGGVPVGYEVAVALDALLDVIMVRKIGAPGHEEYGLGAVVDGLDPQIVLNDEVVRLLRPPPGYVAAEQQRQLAEIERRKELYLHGRPSLPVKGRVVIVIDDGIATGGTVKAALKALSRNGAARVVLAVPVAPSDAVAALSVLADEVICLASPKPFLAVGLHYRDFAQTTDAEVIALLDRAARRPVDQGGHPTAEPLGH